MKPVDPPKTGDDASSKFWQELESRLAPFETHYLHWEELIVHPSPVQSVSHKQWWQLLKAKRRARKQSLPFTMDGKNLYWVLDDQLLKKLMIIERGLNKTLLVETPEFLQAFAEEAIASSTLANAQISKEEALSLLRTGRPPQNGLESSLLSFYEAASILSSTAVINENFLFSLYHHLTGKEARWRNDSDLVEITDRENEEMTYNPVPAVMLSQQLTALITFINEKEEHNMKFMPPVLKAIIAHFMIMAIRPFCSHNDRIARLIFYKILLDADYSMMEFVSISAMILSDKPSYYRAFLYSLSDDGDITYFIIHQLTILLDALLMTKNKGEKRLDELKKFLDALPASVNFRQAAILLEMRESPQDAYRLARYKQRFNITYETARTDLMKLTELGFLQQSKEGKAFIYQAI
jgi:Fic family protein